MKTAKPCIRRSYLAAGVECIAGIGEDDLAVQARAGSWQSNCEGRGDTIWCGQVRCDE